MIQLKIADIAALHAALNDAMKAVQDSDVKLWVKLVRSRSVVKAYLMETRIDVEVIKEAT
jgi:type IV secretory pathway VirB4 component